jgi:hypothetical protein
MLMLATALAAGVVAVAPGQLGNGGAPSHNVPVFVSGL